MEKNRNMLFTLRLSRLYIVTHQTIPAMHVLCPLTLTEAEIILNAAQAIRQHDFYSALTTINQLVDSQIMNLPPDIYNKTLELFTPVLEAAKIYSLDLDKHSFMRNLDSKPLLDQLKNFSSHDYEQTAVDTFTQSFSSFIMDCLDDTYPCIVHHFMFSVMLLSLLVVKRNSITIENEAKVKLEKYLDVSNVIINYLSKRCIYYMEDTPAFLQHVRSHFKLEADDILRRRSEIEAKTHKVIKLDNLQFEKLIVFSRMVREFKDQLKQTFPHIMAYRVNLNKTICTISRDNIYQFLDVTNPNKINAQTNAFITDVWPKIVKWYGFHGFEKISNGNSKLKELYQALFFYPYLLCFSSDYVSVACAHRAYLISQMCKSPNIKRERLCDSLIYMIKRIDTIDFVTCKDIIKIIRHDPHDQLKHVVMSVFDYIQKLRKVNTNTDGDLKNNSKNYANDDDANDDDDNKDDAKCNSAKVTPNNLNIVDKLIGEFEHWFSREMSQTFSSMAAANFKSNTRDDHNVDESMKIGACKKKSSNKKNK